MVMMQAVRLHELQADGGVRLELTPTTTSPLAIDVAESPEMRIQRLISENPVIIFTRSSCCMCHVMKRLLSKVGVHPTVIELDEDEISAVGGDGTVPPALYIGGTRVGGLENLVALHLSGHLEPKLKEVGALTNMIEADKSLDARSVSQIHAIVAFHECFHLRDEGLKAGPPTIMPPWTGGVPHYIFDFNKNSLMCKGLVGSSL